MRLSAPLLALALSTAAVACGGVAEPGAAEGEVLGTQASAVQGGAIDTSADHRFAVGITTEDGAVCSGTLIAPNLVLTARHCVVPRSAEPTVRCSDRFAPSVAPSQLHVTVEANLYRARSYFDAAKIVTPDDDAFCGNDIALIILGDNIPASQAKPATPVVQFAMTDHEKISGAITAVGFGVTSPSAEDSGKRRIREGIEITCVPGDDAYPCDERVSGEVDDRREFVTQGWVCSGDSGSGAFDQRTFDLGEPYVLGTLSRSPQNANTCLAGIYSRTDAHAAMIVAAGLEAAELGGYDAPAWTEPSATAPTDLAGDDDEACEGDACEDDASEAALDPEAAPAAAAGCSASGSRATGNAMTALFGVAVGLAFTKRRRRA